MSRFGFLAESEALLNRKLKSYGAFSASMFYLTAVVGTSLWLWDRVTDADGAHETVVLRLGYVYMALVPLVFKYSTNRHTLAAVAVAATLAAETLFVTILNRLDAGMTYGIGGFMFFMLAPMLVLACFSWKVGVLCAVLAAATPHLLALAGFAPKFEHAHYAVLIWPTVVLMTVAHLAAANNYQDRFDLETALEAASITDALTGLSNRRHFFPALEQELRRHRRYAHSLSVVIVDIDHFKQINDTHGHPTGDRAICAVGDVCRRLARETDLIARLGGEEFAILMPETDAANASEFAERVRGAVEATRLMSWQGVAFQLTVSIGVAELPAGAPGSGNLIDLADSALYQAKGAGRNRVVVSGDPKD